jgi:predicted transcriptional regulator
MKIERVYREILYKILDEKKSNATFKQRELSNSTGLSISTVNYALRPLADMNAINKRQFGFTVIDAKKILFYWASIRKLTKDIVCRLAVNEKVEKIEASVPSRAVFTAYSAFKFKFKSMPSEYSEVVVYGDKEDFEQRFKSTGKYPNLIVLKLDEHLLKFRIAPIAQIFVDLWNLNTWYAKEFLNKLEEIVNGIVE